MQELKRALVLTFPCGGEGTSSAVSTLISRINDIHAARTANLLSEQPFFAVLTSCVCPHLSDNCCLCVRRLNAKWSREAHVKHTLNSHGGSLPIKHKALIYKSNSLSARNTQLSGIIYDCGIVLAPGWERSSLSEAPCQGRRRRTRTSPNPSQPNSNQRAKAASAQRRRRYYLIITGVVVIFQQTSFIQTKGFATFRRV